MFGEWRRGWDSNPRYQSPGITIFETVPFNRSGTPPRMDTVSRNTTVKIKL